MLNNVLPSLWDYRGGRCLDNQDIHNPKDNAAAIQGEDSVALQSKTKNTPLEVLINKVFFWLKNLFTCSIKKIFNTNKIKKTMVVPLLSLLLKTWLIAFDLEYGYMAWYNQLKSTK